MRIVKFWSECTLAGPQFVHPKDAGVLTRFREGAIDLPALDFKRLIRSDRFGDFQDQRFHLSLLPSPYLGSLRHSDIFILALNPGCHPSDYYDEHCVPEFRKRLGANLRQNLSGVRFPFPALDPALCWWGGFRYWEQKLKDVATVLAKEKHRATTLRLFKNSHNASPFCNLCRTTPARSETVESLRSWNRQKRRSALLGRISLSVALPTAQSSS
jgi:hypothetical protein